MPSSDDTERPTVEDIRPATLDQRYPKGTGTTAGVAAAVKAAGALIRARRFQGSLPNLRRELDDGTVLLVNFQRLKGGVIGREPAFTVNLSVISGQALSAWAVTSHYYARHSRGGVVNVGVTSRLGHLAGHQMDLWWNCGEAQQAAAASRSTSSWRPSASRGWTVMAERTARSRR